MESGLSAGRLDPQPWEADLSETDNAQDLRLVREVAPHFRVTKKRGDEIVREGVGAVRGWRAAAKSAGIPRAEQDGMSLAFRVAED